MICERCQKNPATVHVDEVQAFFGPGHEQNVVEEHHLCEVCSQEGQYPHSPGPQKTMDEVWKLLQMSAIKSHKKAAPPALTCETCGTTLEHLRRKGRVGCQACYTTFAQYLEGLLERMHGSVEHVGRLPGVDEEAAQRRREIETTQSELDEAVQTENFERAAELRDELERLSSHRSTAADSGTDPGAPLRDGADQERSPGQELSSEGGATTA